MTNISKYSKEWFATSTNQKQKDALKKLSNEHFKVKEGEKPNTRQVIDKKFLLGSKEEVQQRLSASHQNNKTAQIIQKFGGIDAIFDIVDADENGTITKEEILSITEIDTPDGWDIDKNKTLSINDLHHMFVNLKNSEGAEVTTKDNETTYQYRNGSKTVVTKDDIGNTEKMKKNIVLKGGGVQETEYLYDDKKKIITEFDSEGRQVYYKKDKPGKKRDVVITTNYDIDGSKTKNVETVGRKTDLVYDSSSNLVGKKDSYKYNFEDTDFNQQTIGDCWLLAQIDALNSTPVGKKIVDESIQQNKDGTVTVTLKGAGKSYTYTPEQLCAKEYVDLKKQYSEGNYKVNAMELAFTDLRKERLATEDKETFGRKYSPRATMNDPLRAGGFQEAMQVITGQNPLVEVSSNKIQKQLDNKEKNPDNYALVVIFKNEDKSIGVYANSSSKIVTGHEYSISRVEGDTVYVVNPWDSSDEIAYPKDKFVKNVTGVGALDLSKIK